MCTSPFSRQDFHFHITKFPFLNGNIPSSPAYCVFISYLIRYARVCSSYEYFILRAAGLSCKLLGQGYIRKRSKSFLRKFYSQYGYHQTIFSPPLPNVTWHSGTWSYTVTLSIDRKQNRGTEGCSKLKRSVDMTSSGKNGLNIKTNASPTWDRTRFQRSKRPLLASRTRCNVLWNLQNLVIRSKSVIKSRSVITSQIGVMSDQFRVTLYMVMSQNVM